MRQLYEAVVISSGSILAGWRHIMQIRGSTALVTGANRGIGRGFVEALLERGVRRVYATARNPDSLDVLVARAPGQVIPIELDVTDATEVTAAARVASDVTLLINNGGIAAMSGFLAPPTLDGARAEMEGPARDGARLRTDPES
jgi:NAD(P)-dependent dehydrogenase (short-subunit alcohol dehydrogenase family)